jgi:hypothetical protein
MRRILFALSVATVLAVPAFALDNPEIIERWYVALGKADAGAIEGLLSANAVIKLNDLGVSQTKAEFVASMDEWKGAIAGGTIRHKGDGVVGDAVAYKVCYDFTGNDLLTREVFTFADGAILSSEQTTIAENCDDF